MKSRDRSFFDEETRLSELSEKGDFLEKFDNHKSDGRETAGKKIQRSRKAMCRRNGKRNKTRQGFGKRIPTRGGRGNTAKVITT